MTSESRRGLTFVPGTEEQQHADLKVKRANLQFTYCVKCVNVLLNTQFIVFSLWRSAGTLLTSLRIVFKIRPTVPHRCCVLWTESLCVSAYKLNSSARCCFVSRRLSFPGALTRPFKNTCLFLKPGSLGPPSSTTVFNGAWHSWGVQSSADWSRAAASVASGTRLRLELKWKCI